MVLNQRQIMPEALDELPPEDPRAQRSRRDLRRVHKVMRSLALLQHAWSRLCLNDRPVRIVELGAGDGSLLLRLARATRPPSGATQLVLLDRQPVVTRQTIHEYRSLGWHARTECEDALRWASGPADEGYDLCIATLFLHHFSDGDLAKLLAGVAARSRAFIAIEPRRGPLASVGSHLIGMLGVNAVTREDAVKSVAAGFAGAEITTAWPEAGGSWWTEEFPGFPFSHCFLAARTSARLSPH